ncbi:hypothetical protein C1646_777813 [Rhizophagus diaphanus]|nr:hypothetical protein C1646_777813 [Rhizophagus diaphanus] [Rhizophagus sp. MUCL 43196]
MWEMLTGEFSGKPFDVDTDKVYKDKCKLLRNMKDILDFRTSKILDQYGEKINVEMYNVRQ